VEVTHCLALARRRIAASILMSRMHSVQYLRREERVAMATPHRAHWMWRMGIGTRRL